MPSIAQWISGLFGSVDLAPSDITAAMVLAAAAQRRRRKNRIKKALNPVIKAASNAATSTTTDDVSDIETDSVDASKLCIAAYQRYIMCTVPICSKRDSLLTVLVHTSALPTGVQPPFQHSNSALPKMNNCIVPYLLVILPLSDHPATAQQIHELTQHLRRLLAGKAKHRSCQAYAQRVVTCVPSMCCIRADARLFCLTDDSTVSHQSVLSIWGQVTLLIVAFLCRE